MPNEYNAIEKQLLILIRQFLLEQEMGRSIHAITASTSLDRDLGIDSLGKAELIRRIEKKFDTRLSNAMISEVETISDLTKAIQKAKPKKKFKNENIKIVPPNKELELAAIKCLKDALIQHALFDPNRPHIYLRDENGEEKIINYGDLLSEACSLANGLIAKGIQINDTIAIMLPTSADFFSSFFGALLAGAIPVPIYPPFKASKIEEYIIREAKILSNAEVRCLITFTAAEKLSKLLKSQIESLKLITTVKQLRSNNTSLPNRYCDENSIALIQYTSGSTGDPKGVLLLNKNILSNIRLMGKSLNIQPTDTVVSWLPLYHDMGLLSWIGSLYFGIPITIMSPLTFLNRPYQWLWAIHYHQGTISASPNFGYELCIKKIEEEDIVGLDLSSWRLALNGAETINPKTPLRFYQKFKKYHFHKKAILPVYGLAENTVGLTVPDINKPYKVDKISKQNFENAGLADPAKNDEPYLEFISEGQVIPEHDIRIVNFEDDLMAERHIGSIQFQGPSAMQGYYRNPKATKKAYHNGWWDTGDLGYLADNELFVTGRKKDLIIKAGRNLYPEMFEAIVASVNGIRQGCIIAFGVINQTLGTEKVVIVSETKLNTNKERNKQKQEIIEKITSEIGVPPDEIILVEPGVIPKTSSGKLQRSACKKAYIEKTLTKQQKPLYWQLITLYFIAINQKLKKSAIKFLKILYLGYVGTMFFITFFPIWLCVIIAPFKMTNKIIKFWAKLLLKIAFCRVSINYEKNFSAPKQAIYAVNHASYIDSIVLLAALSQEFVFVGKNELLNVPFLSRILRKMRFIPIDRWDFNKSIEDAKKIQKALENGDSIIIFPEGTFTYATGLRRFKSGAFKLAANTSIPIVPVALSGTRKFLRANSYLLTPTNLKVTFCNLITTDKHGWAAVNDLKFRTQQKIAQYCEEPMINTLT